MAIKLQFVVACALCIIACVHSNVELALNGEAKHRSDVVSIVHSLDKHTLTVLMKSDRLCQEPIFKVRLSGRTLYILDTVDEAHREVSKSNLFQFSYPLLADVGTFYLEVLLLSCETVKPNAFSNQCLEDPTNMRNVLNEPYSFQIDASEGGSPRPRWVSDSATVPAMLHTRYQHSGCRGLCRSTEADIKLHNSYTWIDAPSYRPLLDKTLQTLGQNQHATGAAGKQKITFCMVGSSHARKLADQGNELHLEHVQFAHIDSRFPFQFDPDFLAGCSYAVVGYGQWLLSWVMNQTKNLYTAQMYEEGMRKVFVRLQQTKLPVQVFVRTMNYNGFGTFYTSCPAADHRHPQLVDMYNQILHKVSVEYNVNVIDTTHIQGPMWDGALDYNHCAPKVFTAEIEHILYHALNYSLTNKHTPITISEDTPRGPRNKLIRFEGEKKVYLHAGGVMRAFPDTQTLTTLGYKLNEIMSLDVGKRSDFTFGADLHVVRTLPAAV